MIAEALLFVALGVVAFGTGYITSERRCSKLIKEMLERPICWNTVQEW